jgi:anaerobic magnesium-protoporphyrin IX monomethyl ester cyclase
MRSIRPLPAPLQLTTAERPLRVALVRTPTLTNVTALGQDAVPPIGLAYLAGSLVRAGHHVSAVDAVGEAVHQYSRAPWSKQALIHGLRHEEIVGRIDPQADVIGVACMFTVEWLVARRLIETIRASFPRALIVVGGEHVTACPEFTLTDCPAADVGVLGEGEETLVDLIDAFGQQRDFSTVSGIVFRSNGSPVRTAPRKRIRTIDDIPEPHWDIFPLETYIDNALTHGANLGRSMPILASRGCPYECTFCSSPAMWTTFWTARKPALLLAEMKKYMARYRVTNFDFYDLTAIVKKDWIIEFGNLLLAENLDITWQLPSGTRTEVIDAEVSQLLYRSGCRIINYAPESGSPPELKRIKKKVDPDRMLTSMRASHRAGLQIKTNFIFGLPGSSWGDVARTWKFLARIAWAGVDDVGVFPFSPYPGTQLFDELKAQGKVDLDEAYFASLLAYTDPQHSVSYADFIGSRTLSLLNLSAMAFFYLCSFAFRPARLVRLAAALLTKDTSTKFTAALNTRRRKRLAMRLSTSRGTETVIIPPSVTEPTAYTSGAR